MIHDLAPYPAYKDSGVPWLGDVPAHWEIARLKAHVANIVEPTTERPSDALYVALEHVESWTGRLRDSGPNATFDSQVKRFHAGDVLFGKLRPYLAKVTRPRREGVCVGEFLVLRSKDEELTSAYLEQLVRSKPVIDAINASTFGAKMPRADWQFVGGMRLPIPPLPEQAAIVRFLDHADRRIRRYIRAKQRLIALRDEQKQAIIHRAVTRGLDPTVPLKPSGVEWLGDVPAHWTELSLGVASISIQTGPFGSQLHAGEYVRDGTPVINPSHMRDGLICADPNISVHEGKAEELGRHRLRKDDIVMARRGELGRCALVMEGQEGWLCGTGSLRVRPRRELYASPYLVQLLGSSGVRDSLTLASIGATMDNLNASKVARLRLPAPPVQEQNAIMEWIAHKSSAIDATVSTAQREIALLREYRTRLIADVVTGKLDVRTTVARLVDEAEQLEPLDRTDAITDTDEDVEDNVDAVPEETEA